MKYDIVTYGVPVLRQKAAPILSVGSEVRRLADDMLETMYANQGLGLAAEQVSRLHSICVIDIPRDKEIVEAAETLAVDVRIPMPLIMINPEIVEKTGGETSDEGCLSFPGIYAAVRRATEVTVVYLDLKGEKRTLHTGGLLARAIQHELDHLHGVLLVDRMPAVKKISLAGQLRKLRRESEERFPESC